MVPNKTLFYHGDGTGRDTYIYNFNGGFSPEKSPCKVEEIGSFVIHKQRPRDSLAYIHSKPVNYINNGGGRDTYISDSAGGLKTIYQPAYQKRTFYNGLREYPKIENHTKRVKSNTATFEERNDVFTQSQDHWTKGFRREMTLVSNYQRMMDSRLSKPKLIQRIGSGYREKFFKNTSHEEQQMHMSKFLNKTQTADRKNSQTELGSPFDWLKVNHVNATLGLNFKTYNQNEKPQKLTVVSQSKF